MISPKVYGIGTVLVDCFCFCTESDLARFNLARGQIIEGSQDLLHKLMQCFNFTYYYIGGTTANILRTIQILGYQTQFLGSTSKSFQFNDLYIQLMAQYGVLNTLVMHEQQGLNVALIFVLPDGERTIVYNFSNFILSLNDIDYKTVAEAMLFITDGNMCCSSVTVTITILQLLSLLAAEKFCSKESSSIDHKNGRKYIAFAFPPSLSHALAQKAAILKCIEHADLVFGNILDYTNFYGFTNSSLNVVKEGLLGLNHPDKVYVVTNGRHGAIACTNRIATFQPSEVIKDQVIDTTGAGDSFAGGFITAYLSGKGILECLQFAHSVAAKSVTRLGANVCL